MYFNITRIPKPLRKPRKQHPDRPVSGIGVDALSTDGNATWKMHSLPHTN
ncbi:hypothetical protein [Caulobacter radicis]|nr:hypothetical protein [Caulobacter radicis]